MNAMCDGTALYCELKGWQNAIGTLAGFVTLLLGGLWTFRMNRRRDAELRREEEHSILLALYSEILYLRESILLTAALLARLIQRSDYDTDDPTAFPVEEFDTRFPEPVAYKALVSKIGQLKPDATVAIVAFYTRFADAGMKFAAVLSHDGKAPAKHVTWFLEPAYDALLQIDDFMLDVERSHAMPNYSGNKIKELQRIYDVLQAADKPA